MTSRSIVLSPYVKNDVNKSTRTPAAKLEEICGLAAAIALDIVYTESVGLSKLRAASYIGTGKTDEMTKIIKEQDVEVAIIDAHLTPIQQRNLETTWSCKVIDRTALILEIFGERAQTREGKLQVELAALEYQKGRLVRSWTHLERQRGGFGFVGGPGESQIEMDRRIIRDRITSIKRQLDKVLRTRDLHRKTRQDTPFPLVALVGYTNAGKSTLFNSLTNAGIFAEDALFATLDPTIRNVTLPSGSEILLSDTVGFISELPTELIAAFRATLEEVEEADIIIHVRDVSHADSSAQRKDVIKVLESLLGKDHGKPIIEVCNKIDLLDDEYMLDLSGSREQLRIGISAITGEGLPELLESVDQTLLDSFTQSYDISIHCSDGKGLAWLYANGHVEETEQQDEEIAMKVRLSPADRARFNSMQNQ